MKNSMVALFVIIIIFAGYACVGQESSDTGDVVIPPGMEVVKEGDVNVVVPKGGRLRKQNQVMLIETADEYASRKFEDVDGRFKKVEKELESQKKEIADLRIAVNKLEEDVRKK